MAMRILIVDQFQTFRRDLARYVTFLDDEYEVVGEAATDERAMELMYRLRPNVVLLDIDLPDRNGIQTARRLRAIWPATAVIVITSHAEPDYRRAALDAGAVQCIDKMMLVEELPGALADVSQALAALSPSELPEMPSTMPP